jgi:hypothetical protein
MATRKWSSGVTDDDLSERVAGFRLECMAGFVGIRIHLAEHHGSDPPVVHLDLDHVPAAPSGTIASSSLILSTVAPFIN